MEVVGLLYYYVHRSIITLKRKSDFFLAKQMILIFVPLLPLFATAQIFHSGEFQNGKQRIIYSLHFELS